MTHTSLHILFLKSFIYDIQMKLMQRFNKLKLNQEQIQLYVILY